MPLAQAFEISRSRAHGHVEAVATAMQRLGLAALIAAKPCRERDLVLAVVASRIVAPQTKLATTRWWHTTTLAEDFAVTDASEDDLYAAMDWLLQRQGVIEKKLAVRHLRADGLVLYDLSSSYFEGATCALARLRAHKREELLCATEKNLETIKARVDAAKLAGQAEIGVRVGKIINQYKVAKHFELAIGAAAFSFQRKSGSIAAEAALDGIYLIRTSVPATHMAVADCVRNYKSLSNVERAFRSLKTIDLKVRPIHHRLADRVRSHIFLCMLAYYVEWHMREAWRELMFAGLKIRRKLALHLLERQFNGRMSIV